MTDNKVSSDPLTGDVEINLDGHGAVMLKASLGVAMRLSNMPGGIAKLVDRCLSYEFDAILLVVAEGIGGTSKDLPEIVFRTGMVSLAPHCIEFLHVVANGGKAIDSSPDNEEATKGPLDKS